ncbi:MAG: aminoacyl-tRNA hydrolase [Zavarzinella sp.]
MKLVVGLGNPGPKYEQTRHNVGFMVLDYLAAAPGVSSWKNRFQGETAEALESDHQVLYLKPQTFMNLSGRSVRQAVDFYKVSLDQVLVICDDLTLPLGKIRLRTKGTHGGQNGLRNIQEMLASTEYPRLRLGIGSPGEYEDAADYVLGRFRSAEKAACEEMISLAAQAALLWVREGIEPAMNRYNGGSEPDANPKKKKPRPANRDSAPAKTEDQADQ